MTYKIEHCIDHQVWEDFVANSPQGCIFCTKQFLDAWEQDAEILIIIENNQIQLGAILMNRDMELINPPIRYQGVLFSGSIMNYTHGRDSI